jgi:hypothetical protein
LAKIVEDVIRGLQFKEDRAQEVKNALSQLQDIEQVYQKSEEELYEGTLDRIGRVALMDFEARGLLEGLVEQYFKQLPLFRESYEIAVLNSQDQKYQRLVVKEQFIQLTIPVPYACPPLKEAKFIGEAKCFTFEEETDHERFS